MTFRIDRDMTNEEYHSGNGYFSSSQLKDALIDPEYFHLKHIKKEIGRESLPAFDIGTYYHTAILEPEKLETECCVFEGIRRGPKWEKFKEENSGKLILNSSGKEAADVLIQATRKNEIAMSIVNESDAEISAFATVLVDHDEIYHVRENGDTLILLPEGWEKVDYTFSIGAIQIGLKVRADIFNLNAGYIADLKSTTGNAKDSSHIQSKISLYSYDLSASLYLDVFSLGGETFSDFIWIFASKDFGNSKCYAANSEVLKIGRLKWRRAVINIAKGIRAEWEFKDELGMISPSYKDLDFLKGETSADNGNLL